MDTVSESPGPQSGSRKWVIRGLVALAALIAAILAATVAQRQWVGRGPYRIGWEIDDPEQIPGPRGEPTGVAIEVLREAARRRGISLIWVQRTDGSEGALRSGEVDLWPLITITPERLKVVHISTPYLESFASFMVRRDTPFRSLEDLSRATVGYTSRRPRGSWPPPIELQLLSRYRYGMKMVPHKTRRELFASLCRREIDAAFIDQNAVILELMSGQGANCGTQGFAMIPFPGSRISLGVGSTMKAGAVADALREEIDGMSADGWLANLFLKWGYLPGRGVAYLDSLRSARQRERWTAAAAIAFASLFLLALFQTWRYFRESRRARLAESALLRSIAESRQIEERLRLLAHALRCATDCISIAGTDRRFIYVNEAFLRTYEYEESELIGQPTTMLRSTRADRLVDSATSGTMIGENWRREIWNRSKSGREFPVSLAVSRVRDENGSFIALVGVATDISDRRKAEEEYRELQAQYLQAQKLESIGQLAGGVAHDFNNILTVILGYTKKLLATIDGAHPFHGPLSQISLSAAKAAALTSQLLTFSRRNSGVPKTICLDAIVTGIEPMLRRLIEEHIEVILSPRAEHGFIHADPALIEQVIFNLTVNARDAMPEGGRLIIETSRITVSNDFAAQALSVPKGSYLSLAVSDTGTGMTPEVKARLFEPFFTTKEPGKGTGLGLATVYGIVKQYGGAVTVHSSPGIGTSVKAFFPSAPEGVPEESPAPQTVPFEGEGDETVLLVEDESGVRNFVREVLEEHGYRVLDASNGPDAIEITRRCTRTPIDLLLTDMVLPGMNGIEVIRQFSALHPGVPVIRMSGYAERFGAQMLQDIPYLPKPFAPEVLLSLVRSVLDMRRSKAAAKT